MPHSQRTLYVMSNVGLTAEVGGQVFRRVLSSELKSSPSCRDGCTSPPSPIPVRLPLNKQGGSLVLPGCSVLHTTDKEVCACSNVLQGLPSLPLVLSVQCHLAVQSLEETVSPCLTSEWLHAGLTDMIV